MDWFLYDNGLRHERVKMIEFISNGVDIDVLDDHAIWMFFSKKTQMLRTKFFVIVM